MRPTLGGLPVLGEQRPRHLIGLCNAPNARGVARLEGTTTRPRHIIGQLPISFPPHKQLELFAHNHHPQALPTHPATYRQICGPQQLPQLQKDSALTCSTSTLPTPNRKAFMGGGINAFSGAVGPPQTPAKPTSTAGIIARRSAYLSIRFVYPQKLLECASRHAH